MSVYGLKPKFQDLLRPLCRWMALRRITANQVTLLAVVLSFIIGGLVWVTGAARWALILVPLALFARMALNAIDGMLAREFNMKSSLGAVLNELGDVVSDSAIYLPLALIPGMATKLLILMVVLAVISEMAGVVAIQIGSSRRYDGPMGKSDRAFVLGLLAFLLGLGVPAGAWTHWVIAIIDILLLVTIWNRASNAIKEPK